MLELLDVLEKVFSMHVPWHSENDKLGALSAIQNARDEINPPLLEKLVPNEDVMPVEPATTAVPVENVSPAAETVTVTTETTPAADAATADNFVPDPELTPFPGSYTPPPAA